MRKQKSPVEYNAEFIEVAFAALEIHKGDETATAKFLGVPVKTLRNWIQQASAATEMQEARAARVDALKRPMPPDDVLDPYNPEPLFLAAPDMTQWIAETFTVPGATLYNEDHVHLGVANIGVQWTNVAMRQKMKDVAGTAGIPRVQGDMWTKARVDYHLRQMFGFMPDFLITLYAPYAARVSNRVFCALVEHELYHCAQAIDQFGDPKINEEGLPVWAIRGHDVEVFIGEVQRYGAGAAAGMTKQLIEAAKHPPLIAESDINAACGTCLR